jgi:hypothetical protein
MVTVDEQNRLMARIADFELRILELRKNACAGSGFLHKAEHDQILQMLVRTLRALKVHKACTQLGDRNPPRRHSYHE